MSVPQSQPEPGTAPPAAAPPAAAAPAAAAPAANRRRLQSLAPIAVFDVIGPLVAYSLLRSNGFSPVTALVLSGVLPAFGVALAVVRHRRLDAIGALVLVGIAVGAVLGLASGSARLVLLEDSVPTAIFAVVCLASLWSSRPLMYRFALEFIGADTPRGRDFADRWRYPGFRHTFRVMTAAWGLAYLAEAAARILIVELTSAGTALSVSKVMPFAVAAVLVAWMFFYGQRARRKGERAAEANRARGEAPPVMPS